MQTQACELWEWRSSSERLIPSSFSLDLHKFRISGTWTECLKSSSEQISWLLSHTWAYTWESNTRQLILLVMCAGENCYKLVCLIAFLYIFNSLVTAWEEALFGKRHSPSMFTRWVVFSAVRFSQLSCCCVSWSWAAILLEFQFHYLCWCC